MKEKKEQTSNWRELMRKQIKQNLNEHLNILMLNELS